MIKILVTLLILNVTLITGNLITSPTGSPVPTPRCIGFDTCKTFGGWKEGQFRHPFDPTAFISCIPSNHPDGGIFSCGVCHPPLYYSEKCGSCEYFEEDTLNECTTTKLPNNTISIPEVSYNKDYCKTKLQDGNYEDPTNKSFYYSCVYTYTYHMWCGSDTLYYNATCDACLHKNSGNNPQHVG